VLNTTPETDTNPLDSTHTITATVRTTGGTLQSNITVDFEVTSGPNEDVDNDADGPDRSCTTGTSGTCTVSYTDSSATSGEVDQICSWIDSDGDDVFNDDGDQNDGGDCDGEDRAESEGTNGWGTDVTDRVAKTWSSTASGTAIYLNLVPESDENELRDEHEVTAVARNSNGNVVSNVDVDFEIIEGPNSDLEGSEVDMECTTASDGTCEVSYDDEAADVGEDDFICGWLDTGDDNDFDDDGSDEDGGDCEDEDENESENSARSGTDAFGSDATDVVTKTWVASSDAFYLNATPESSTGDPGSQHTLSVTTRTDEGELAEGVSVDFEIISGPNSNLDGQSSDADMECTTNSSGTCSVTYTGGSGNTGSDLVCAWLDIEDDDDFSSSGSISDGGACDEETVGEPEDSGEPGQDTFGNDATDTVRRNWGEQPPTGELPRACQVQGAIVGTNGDDTLVGTAGNDVICGLGGADSILGHGGNDLIIAGGGDDNLRGGAGGDRIRTGRGNDTAVGQGGPDNIRGNSDDDYLLGSGGNDLLFGGSGDDVLDGGRAFDGCRGGRGQDRSLRCES
jgi:Ca2+-binding RTX toxin-like protein